MREGRKSLSSSRVENPKVGRQDSRYSERAGNSAECEFKAAVLGQTTKKGWRLGWHRFRMAVLHPTLGFPAHELVLRAQRTNVHVPTWNQAMGSGAAGTALPCMEWTKPSVLIAEAELRLAEGKAA
jgi:hypothetical protein